MILSHPDGTETLVTTDENTWKVNIGPIIESGIYDGEVYDANLEVPWLESDFDDSSWSGVEKHKVDIPNFNFSLGEKVRKINEITPIEIINGPDGSKILDMGQNMVGWLRLRLKNTKPGQKILIKHGELMDGKISIPKIYGMLKLVWNTSVKELKKKSMNHLSHSWVFSSLKSWDTKTQLLKPSRELLSIQR